MIEAFHLPALNHLPSATWSYGTGADAVHLRIPQLTPALLRRQVASLLAAREEHLAERPVSEIVQVIGQVAARLADPEDELRQTAELALPNVTGYSALMIRKGLDRMAGDWRPERLCELLRAEFGDPAALDEFRPRGAFGRSRAFGPRLTTHIFSGNVPGVAVTSLIRSLLVKSSGLGKVAAGEPLLAALFARGVAQADPDLGACLAVTYWPGGNAELEQIALNAADAVITYGGTDAVESVRDRTPAGTRFLGYGHKLSFGVIGREVLSSRAKESAATAALEVAIFDQQGCVAPHLFYVEEGGKFSPRRWARMVGEALQRLEGELPRGSLAPSEAAAIRQLRTEAEFAQIGGSGVELFASPEGTAWTVIYDPDPTFAASCLNRVVRVKPVRDLEEVPGHVERLGPLLQTVGVEAAPERRVQLAERLGRLGASRIAPLGEMAWPPPGWHHDGRPPLRDLVRWCDLESAEGSP